MAALCSNSPKSSSSSQYEGQFDAQHRSNGDGILTTQNTTFEGTWRHGLPVSGQWLIQSQHFRYSGDARATPDGASLPLLFHGSGTLKNRGNGEVYIGQFAHNKKHGHGMLINADTTISGTWCEDEYQAANNTTIQVVTQNGYGSITTQHGSTYDGCFENGKRHGQGTYIDGVSSVKYEGDWIEDLRDGHGLLFDHNNKLLFDGTWSKDKKIRGKCFDPVEKWSYEGEVSSAGQFHGQGTFLDRYGNSYVGTWVKGEKEGHGCEKKTSNGGGGGGGGSRKRKDKPQEPIVYIGEFKKGLRHGEGQILFPDGQSYHGQWDNNKKHGHGTETSSCGDLYEGQWSLNKPMFGHAVEWTICYANQEKYVGTCCDRKGCEFQPEGSGTYKYSTGDVFIGDWHEGVRHGKGVMYHASGDVEETEWVNGVTLSLMSLLT